MTFFQKMKLNRLLKKLKKQQQAREQGTNRDFKQEINLLHQLGQFYDRNGFNKNFPRAATLALEYYRAAAVLDDSEANYICGRRLVELAQFWQAWADGFYGIDVHQIYANQYYAEALNCFTNAETSGHVLAKRWHGLAHIRGWGVPVNTDTGFKLVVDSIEMQGAWANATQIFTELGLNSPEFFTALMSLKRQQT